MAGTISTRISQLLSHCRFTLPLWHLLVQLEVDPGPSLKSFSVHDPWNVNLAPRTYAIGTFVLIVCLVFRLEGRNGKSHIFSIMFIHWLWAKVNMWSSERTPVWFLGYFFFSSSPTYDSNEIIFRHSETGCYQWLHRVSNKNQIRQLFLTFDLYYQFHCLDYLWSYKELKELQMPALANSSKYELICQWLY